MGTRFADSERMRTDRSQRLGAETQLVFATDCWPLVRRYRTYLARECPSVPALNSSGLVADGQPSRVRSGLAVNGWLAYNRRETGLSNSQEKARECKFAVRAVATPSKLSMTSRHGRRSAQLVKRRTSIAPSARRPHRRLPSRFQTRRCHATSDRGKRHLVAIVSRRC